MESGDTWLAQIFAFSLPSVTVDTTYKTDIFCVAELLYMKVSRFNFTFDMENDN